MERGHVIIGAGECGVRAAMALRENGYAGPVTLVGAEVHLPYERPPLSKDAMLSPEPPAPRTIASLEKLAEAGIATVLGANAETIARDEKSVLLSDGTTLPYDKLLLATGARPRRLSMDGADSPHMVTLRTFEDAQRIRGHLRPGQHVAIIGGGFIGLELAASARQRGADVTIIEALPRLLARAVPESMAREIEARHRAEGVFVFTGQTIVALDSDDTSAFIALASGENVMADLVIVGIGAVPNTGLAEAAGLDLGNGIAVDATLRTSDSDIFAAGDCCSFPLPIYGGRRVRLESWRNAQDQGNLAARNMLGAGEAISSVPWFWSDQYDRTLQIAGLADEGTQTVRRDIAEDAYLLFHFAGDGRLVAASGIGTGNAVARDIRLAEMLIGKGARPDQGLMADPSIKLKSLLAA